MLPWCAFDKQPSNSASWERVLLHDQGSESANAQASTHPVQKDTETGFVFLQDKVWETEERCWGMP